MKSLTKVACIFYGTGIAGLGVQQFIYSDFRPVILPPWPLWMHVSGIGAWISGAALVIAGVLIASMRKSYTTALFLGGFLLALFIIFQVPYVIFIQQYSPLNLGLWTDPLKEMALAGGAFVIAGLLKIRNSPHAKNTVFNTALEKLIPAGSILFSITMILFGIDHFLYTDFVATLVPSWIPGPVFWTYFAAVALIGSGAAIILKIKLELIGQLLATMLFLWLILLHIPRAIADPRSGNGNEITSVFEALAFSGIALAIACIGNKQLHGADMHGKSGFYLA
jgi:uncharacterized membrane protein